MSEHQTGKQQMSILQSLTWPYDLLPCEQTFKPLMKETLIGMEIPL